MTDAAARKIGGGAFLFDGPAEVPAVWGKGSTVLWPEGESLEIVGPEGVGKSSVAQQIMIRLLDVAPPELFGLPIAPADGSVVYLAMDRPPQVRRSMRRMVDEHDRGRLDERLGVWQGPLPVNPLRSKDELADWLATEWPDVAVVIVDSLKDLAPKLSDDETGSKVNLARQEILARGIQVLELHHQRKEQRGEGKPKALADVYGSRWLTAGAGSVLLLWGEPGDSVVEIAHLKQPADEFGPHKILHDHKRGHSTLYEPADLLQIVMGHPEGILVADAAKAIFETTATPTANQIEKARRRLNRLADDGKVALEKDAAGIARYRSCEMPRDPREPKREPLTNSSRSSRNGSTKPHAPLTTTHDGVPNHAPSPIGEGVSGNVSPELQAEADRIATLLGHPTA